MYNDTGVNSEKFQAFFFNDETWDIQDLVERNSNWKWWSMPTAKKLKCSKTPCTRTNPKEISTAFQLMVHDPDIPAQLRREGIEVSFGYETTILITPRVIETTADA